MAKNLGRIARRDFDQNAETRRANKLAKPPSHVKRAENNRRKRGGKETVDAFEFFKTLRGQRRRKAPCGKQLRDSRITREILAHF